MNFFNQLPRLGKRKQHAYSLIDVGQDTIKAVIVLRPTNSAEGEIVGCGLADANSHDITGGRMEAESLTVAVNEALTHAEDISQQLVGQKIVPDDVIFALPGRATMGKLFTTRQIRPRPNEPISAKELASLHSRVERLAQQNLLKDGHWQPLAMTKPTIRLDDQVVLRGVGLTASEISLSLFGVAVQNRTLRALESLAESLGLNIIKMVAASHALAAIVPASDAIVLDIGFSGTGIYLIQNGMVANAKEIPFGGNFFTQSLAQATQTKPMVARELKHSLTGNELPAHERKWIQTHLADSCQRWGQAVLELLISLAINKSVPRKIYLTGGGSKLAGLDKLLGRLAAPCDYAPDVAYLKLPPMKNRVGRWDINLFALTVGVGMKGEE